MLTLVAAALLAASSLDHDDDNIITEIDMLDAAGAEIRAWNSCVQRNVGESVTGTLAQGRSPVGLAVDASFSACSEKEGALKTRLQGKLNNDPAADEWVSAILNKIRQVLHSDAIRTALKLKIGSEQTQTCQTLRRSGGIPEELIEVCDKYRTR